MPRSSTRSSAKEAQATPLTSPVSKPDANDEVRGISKEVHEAVLARVAELEAEVTAQKAQVAEATKDVAASAAKEAAATEVAAARLDSFESDVAIVPGTTGEGEGEDEDDDEFVFNENARDGEAVIVKGKKKAGKRTTRGVAENRRAVAARTFNALLEQSFIDRAPEGTPTYLTAAAGPSKASAPRKFCSVCGFQAPYGCARCGMRFCSKKCSAVHAETRCLKMVG